jgi:TM2 domain-containing membrane protein YozV
LAGYQIGQIRGVASEVLCGRCGALLADPNAPCPRCGSPASGAYQGASQGAYQAAYPGAYRQSRKNPALAAALAIVPGLGHFYLGHNVKGIAYLVGIGGLQFFGFDLDLTVVGAAVGVPMELGGGGLWLFSIVDAYRTAKRMETTPGR